MSSERQGEGGPPVLVITGPVGVGKTTVAGAVSHLLAEAGLPHALVDLDGLRWCYPAPADDPFHTALGLRNLAGVWAGHHAAGARRLVLADVVETTASLAGYRTAIPGAVLTVVRLQAALPTIRSRLAARETGASLRWHQDRAAVLQARWEAHPVEDLLVDTEGRSAGEVARDVVERTRWVPPPHPEPRPPDPAR